MVTRTQVPTISGVGLLLSATFLKTHGGRYVQCNISRAQFGLWRFRLRLGRVFPAPSDKFVPLQDIALVAVNSVLHDSNCSGG
jgi:hypothetical protein